MPSVAVVVSRFHESITTRLLEGALACLDEHGVEAMAMWVPGAFELPLVAKKCARSGKYDAVICLGAIIRGETPHFDYVAGQAAAGVMHAQLETEVPIIFSVLTTNSLAQAEERISYGRSGALAAIEMARVVKCV